MRHKRRRVWLQSLRRAQAGGCRGFPGWQTGGTVLATAPAATSELKKAASGSKAREPAGPRVTELITKAVYGSKECKGFSLAPLRKALATSGYNVEKSKSRIKLGPKSLISNGTLVQTKGIGGSGSFKLNKKLGETKEKATKKKTAAKPKKPAAKKPANSAKKPTKAAAVKTSPEEVKKLAGTAAKKAAKSPKRAPQAGHPKKAVKSPAKAKSVKPKAAKPKAAKPKAAKAKKSVPKKK